MQGLSGDACLERWQKSGFAENNLPRYHFFNSRYELGLDLAPSDYDFQLSSDTLAQRLENYRTQHPSDDIISAHGGHFRFRYVARLFPPLAAWSEKWAEVTGRDCNIASFPGNGPEGVTRFDDHDWVVVAWKGD